MAHLKLMEKDKELLSPQRRHDEDLRVLVGLKKKPVPAITIYGDTDGKVLAKTLWSSLAGWEIRLLTPDDEDNFHRESYKSALVFVVITSESDSKILISRIISDDADVVADVIAITHTEDPAEQLRIQAMGFDHVLPWSKLETEDFRDIFYHKLRKGIVRLNARIKEQEYQSFQAYLSASADAFVVFDQERKIFFISQLFKNIYPRSSDKLIRGVPVQRVFEAIADEMGISQIDSRYDEMKQFWLRLDGQQEVALDSGATVRLTAVPMPDGQGTIVSMTDITDYKNAQKFLALKQEQLEIALESEQEASNLQRQFISLISHEFRTPLSIIDGNAQAIQRRKGAVTQEDLLKRTKTIRSAVSRLLHMMEGVLSSNMLKTGRLDVTLELFNLRQLIEELCQEQADLAQNHKFILNLQKMPENVVSDRKIITLILTNLISNAVKYSQVAPIVEIEGFTIGSTLILTVKDNGLGIPAEELPNIFGRFFRASTAGAIKGTGLGLALTKGLVTLLGGRINAESDVGKGSVFRVELPMK